MSENETEEDPKQILLLFDVEQAIYDVYSEQWALEENKVGLIFPFIQLE